MISGSPCFEGTLSSSGDERGSVRGVLCGEGMREWGVLGLDM